MSKLVGRGWIFFFLLAACTSSPSASPLKALLTSPAPFQALPWALVAIGLGLSFTLGLISSTNGADLQESNYQQH